MKQLYLFSLSVLLLSACATRVRYVGTRFAPSQQVDVFVTKNSIKKPYDIIGKGYVRTATYFSSEEKVQRKAVQKARENGAHAVLIEDYFVLHNNNTVSSAAMADSSGRLALSVGNVTAHPAVATGMQVWFLRYK